MPVYFEVEGEVCGQSLAGGDALGDVSLSRTALHNCHARLARKPKDRPVLRRIALHRIQHWACSADGACLDGVTVTDLRGGGRAPSFLWGCAYRHVTLRGSIGGLMFRWQADPRDARTARRYHEANLELYESVDWALDTTEARFTFLESLMGIPPQLVRRDPETQFILERQAAQTLLDESEHSVWSVVAQRLLESPLSGVVVAVGGRGAKLKAELDEARVLREEGLLS